MFERFTADARAVVVEAQTVARQTGTSRIDARQLLVALVELDGPASRAFDRLGVDRAALARQVRAELASGGLDAQALGALGIDLEAVRQRADEVFGAGALDRGTRKLPAGHIPFAGEAKKILELALREAVRLRSSSIDGGMILLGVLRADDTAAATALRQALVAADSDVTSLRTVVEQAAAAAKAS